MQGKGPHAKDVILVADNDAASRRRLTITLSRLGYEVLEHDNGEDALSSLTRRSVDVVIVDLKSPGMSGIDLCKKMRSAPGLGRIPVVFITDRNDRDFKVAGMEAGGDDFLSKPVDDIVLLSRVKNLSLVRKYNKHLERERVKLMKTVEEQNTLLSKAMIEIGKAKRTVQKFNEEIIFRLSRAVEFRDDETGNHVQRMSRYCGLIATKMGMSKEVSEAVRIASALHDVGKIAIPDDILHKPGRLTAEEMGVMRRHAEKGFRVLTDSESSLLELAATIARSHHERYDGKGYPQNLSGKDIPFEGRIAAVADVFDALTSKRVYKPAFSVPEAVQVLLDERGTGFDPQIVDAFIGMPDAVKNIMIVYADR